VSERKPKKIGRKETERQRVHGFIGGKEDVKKMWRRSAIRFEPTVGKPEEGAKPSNNSTTLSEGTLKHDPGKRQGVPIYII